MLSLLQGKTTSISLLGNQIQGSWYVGESSDRLRLVEKGDGGKPIRGYDARQINLTLNQVENDTK